jgi:hypothetical protein
MIPRETCFSSSLALLADPDGSNGGRCSELGSMLSRASCCFTKRFSAAARKPRASV